MERPAAKPSTCEHSGAILVASRRVKCSLIACGLLDVPVYDSIVESLHVLFSVYLEFTENVHFQQQVPADGPQVMTN